MQEIPIAIIYTVLMGVLPSLSIINTIYIIKLDSKIKDNNSNIILVSMLISLMLLLPSIIIVLSLINSMGGK